MDASSSLLNQDKSSNQNDSFPSIRALGKMLGFQDPLQQSTLKAISKAPGKPKEKHIENLVRVINSDYSKFEEVLIIAHALSSWRKSIIVVFKVLVLILAIHRESDKLNQADYQSLLKFLNDMKYYWATDQIINQFVLYNTHKASFYFEHGNLVECIRVKTVKTNDQNMVFQKVDLLAALSQLYCCQDRLIIVLRTIVRGCEYDNLPTKAVATFLDCFPLLWNEAHENFALLLTILKEILGADRELSESTKQVVKDQFAQQFDQLHEIHKNSNVLQLDEVLSKFPLSNPAL